jgi:hypothetical protein
MTTIGKHSADGLLAATIKISILFLLKQEVPLSQLLGSKYKL